MHGGLSSSVLCCACNELPDFLFSFQRFMRRPMVRTMSDTLANSIKSARTRVFTPACQCFIACCGLLLDQVHGGPYT